MVENELADLARSKVLRDSACREAVDVGTLWRDLIGGRVRVVDCYFTEHSCLMAIEDAPSPIRIDRRLATKKLNVLERVLLRGGQKAVAAELGLAPSTVAIIAGGCLRAMGLDCGASRAPLPLWLAVHAFYQRTEYWEARAVTVSHAERAYRVLAVCRPEEKLKDLLSPAEYAVTRLLVEGRSHADMAAIRHTSVRTIANQLASAFHKLGVSGRSELLCLLVARGAFVKPQPFQPASLEPPPLHDVNRDLPPIADVVNA